MKTRHRNSAMLTSLWPLTFRDLTILETLLDTELKKLNQFKIVCNVNYRTIVGSLVIHGQKRNMKMSYAKIFKHCNVSLYFEIFTR